MALNSLVIPPGQTPGQTMQATPTGPGASFSQIERRNSINGFDFGNPVMLQPRRPGFNISPPSVGGIHSIISGPGLISDGNYTRPMPLPVIPPGGGSIMPVRPLPSPPVNNRPGPIFGLRPRLPEMPDYSSQFEKFGEQLTGFGDQMTGYQDALGSFNEQVGGMGKQFETITNRLDSVDKGLGSLGNQIASLENMQQAQPQQVMQPQQQSYNPFGFGGFGGFGGLASLFGRRY